jgi:hypothetical protein
MIQSDRASGVASSSRMLRICSAHGCLTVVFGGGTCVAHDPPAPTAIDMLLAEAMQRLEEPLQDDPRSVFHATADHPAVG